MLARLGAALSRWCSRWVPDPLVLAFGLTLAVFALAFYRRIAGGEGAASTLGALAGAWAGTREGGGLASTSGLAFAMQMCIVLVTGHAMALSPPMQRLIAWLAHLPRTAATATACVAAVACAAGLIHWGLGAIAGALLAREIGRHALARGLRVHYPLLGAAAYSGMAVWHGGLSGSAPLKVAEAGLIGLDETLGSTLNLVVSGSMVAVIVLLYWRLTPRDDAECVMPDAAALVPLPAREPPIIDSAVAWVQESPWPGRLLGSAALVYVVAALATGKRDLEINSVNLSFLSLGLILQGSLRHYMDAVADGARGAGAIIVQFPLYYGILGLMQAGGIVEAISDAFAALATATTFPVWAFLSSGLVNLFIPSGGGQWAVQESILMGAGARLGVDPATTIMAFSYGDAWTNLLQPFWALPLLGIMGLRARDVMGYTVLVCGVLGVVISLLLLTLG